MLKPIRYTNHLEERLASRRIDRDVPESIIRTSSQLFTDMQTGYHIAVATAPYRGKNHLMMVAYEETEDELIAVTVHPLEKEDVRSKIKIGRWKR